MRCILSSDRNIYFHLAAEEYLLKNSSEEICMIWESDKAAVVGKHQNTMAEVNYSWCLDNNILIARRLTGGGTVFHGAGNLNFTFIRSGEKGKLVDFKRFVGPVVEFLRSLQIPATIGSRNDIRVNDLKISGNAEHVYRSRVLHHGTLLFSADLDMLNHAIRVLPGKFHDKAVKSVRSAVTNINDLIVPSITFMQFTERLYEYLVSKLENTEISSFSAEEINSIAHLAKEKYSTWDWIFAYSPGYTLTKTVFWNGAMLTITLTIEKGVITTCKLVSKENDELVLQINERLTGTKYDLKTTRELLTEMGADPIESGKLSGLFY
jgi:lipoate-protein ligase A